MAASAESSASRKLIAVPLRLIAGKLEVVPPSCKRTNPLFAVPSSKVTTPPEGEPIRKVFKKYSWPSCGNLKLPELLLAGAVEASPAVPTSEKVLFTLVPILPVVLGVPPATVL